MQQVILTRASNAHQQLLYEVYNVIKEDKDYFIVDLSNKAVLTGHLIFKSPKDAFIGYEPVNELEYE